MKLLRVVLLSLLVASFCPAPAGAEGNGRASTERREAAGSEPDSEKESQRADRPPEGAGARKPPSPAARRPPPGLRARAKAAVTHPRASGGWTWPASAGESVHLTLTLKAGATEDRLLKITTGWADTATVVITSTDLNGKNRMVRPVNRIYLAPGAQVVFRTDQPTGFGLVIGPLRRDLLPEQTFPLILHFEKAGSIPVSVQVREP